MDSSEQVIDAFVTWFEEGFRPERDYRDVKEHVLAGDMLEQLELWVQKHLPGWDVKKATKPKSQELFGYTYTADIELVRAGEKSIPIEIELMKKRSGWKPSEAIGQVIMFSRQSGVGKGIAAVLDVRKDPPEHGEVERSLQDDLWEKLGVRLCVRRGE
jgi:hypothetical protein